jgi:hypothetical protein
MDPEIESVLSQLTSTLHKIHFSLRFVVNHNASLFPVISDFIQKNLKDDFFFNRCVKLTGTNKILSYQGHKSHVQDFKVYNSKEISNVQRGIFLWMILLDTDTNTLKPTFIRTEHYLEFGTKHAGLTYELEKLEPFKNFRIVMAGELELSPDTVEFNSFSGTFTLPIYRDKNMQIFALKFAFPDIKASLPIPFFNSLAKSLNTNFKASQVKELRENYIPNILQLFIAQSLKDSVFKQIFSNREVKITTKVLITPSLSSCDVYSYAKSLCKKPLISKGLFYYDDFDKCTEEDEAKTRFCEDNEVTLELESDCKLDKASMFDTPGPLKAKRMYASESVSPTMSFSTSPKRKSPKRRSPAKRKSKSKSKSPKRRSPPKRKSKSKSPKRK